MYQVLIINSPTPQKLSARINEQLAKLDDRYKKIHVLDNQTIMIEFSASIIKP
jgi:hypothetical protein